MKRYLLDTNVVSELRKTTPHGAVVAWLNDLRDEQIFLSAVTLGELQIGVERVRHTTPPRRRPLRLGSIRWRLPTKSCPWMAGVFVSGAA